MKFSLRHQSAGKLYPPLALFGYAIHWPIFRKVHINNRHGVPSDKPVLLAANHPSAAMEPLLLTIYLDPPIYNMTRGDIFKKPFFRKLMENINMFPVYRKRDGYTEKDRNDGVFEFCIDKLKQGRVVTIYVEGEHKLVKRVRPVQKGLARIAFASYERQQNPDLQIIPAGCNYAYGDRTRDEAFVNIGAPIYLCDYWEHYQRDPNNALLKLCRDIEQALKKVCYHIEDPNDEVLADQMLIMFRSDHPQPIWPFTVYDGKRFEAEKAVLERLNAMPAEQKAGLREKTATYFNALQSASLDDDALRNPSWGNARWLFFLLPGALPALVGWLANLPISATANWVAAAKVKKVEFKITVIAGLGYLLGWIYYPLLWLIAILLWHAPTIAFVLLLPLLRWFGLVYYDIFTRWRAARKALTQPKREELLELRKRVFES
ncbi:MAG: 1-acyl-sn-glycerol-3-phosphate acyltransferase [Saprospiraceae bacterium]|nr:1-acyl-sn-glycerol-3-phosphate acyltransferase [Saprospiraceae bacterium]